MASTVDPFAAYRNGQEASPVDKLKDGDFEELKLEIRNMYRMMFKDEVAIASLSKSGTVPSEPKDVIVQYLEAALAMSPDFQKAVLEEYVTPYMYNFSDLRVKEEWAIGVFLPGFYSFFDTFEAGFAFIKKVLPDAATTARMTIETLIRKHIPGQMQALRFAEIRGPVDSTISQTNPYIATLFQLIQEEKKLNDLRARSSQTLGDLNNILPDLEGAQDLQALYKKKLTTTVGDSLIDRFTGVALGAAKGLGGIPELVSVDTASVREAVGKIRNLVDFAGDQAKEFTEEMDLKEDEEEDEEEVADDDQDDIEVPTEHVPDDRSDTDELPEEALVAEEVRSHYAAHGRTPIFYPGWAPPTKTIYWESSKAASSIEASQLSQGSNLRSQEHSTASISGPSATLATKLKRSHGFISARGLSHKEIDDIDRKVHTPQDVLNGAISYIRQATSKESDRFNAAKYQQCVAWLVKTNKRSDKAEAAKHSDQWFRMFCGFQMEDNWVHVRFLIEALRVECEGRSEYGEIWKLLGGVERILVIAFALIRCGADDPLPWILVVDGVLRKLLRKLGSFSSSGEPTLLQKKVFGELALWCHGTAINAFIIRLPPLEDRYVKGQELMKKWYRMVWTYNPRCANNDCMRLLTHPDNMANKKVRELMSVGTREARVGSRSMRSFISTNRDCAYTCLFEVFRNSEPNGVLVILLFWYSHLYHNRTCKAHSGKPAISAF